MQLHVKMQLHVPRTTLRCTRSNPIQQGNTVAALGTFLGYIKAWNFGQNAKLLTDV